MYKFDHEFQYMIMSKTYMETSSRTSECENPRVWH